jgi:RNA polymerase sigma factor (sigma-70 family)
LKAVVLQTKTRPQQGHSMYSNHAYVNSEAKDSKDDVSLGNVLAESDLEEGDNPLDFNEHVAGLRVEMLNFARRLTGNAHHRADDIVQDAFIRALRGWPSFQPETSDVRQCVRNYLYCIVRNVFLTGIKSDKNRPDRVRMTEHVDTHEDFCENRATLSLDYHVTEDPRVSQDEETGDEVLAAIASLEPKWRLVVEHYYFDDLTTSEIAERLGVPRKTVQTRLYRARLLLQDALQEYALETGHAKTGVKVTRKKLGPGAGTAIITPTSPTSASRIKTSLTSSEPVPSVTPCLPA